MKAFRSILGRVTNQPASASPAPNVPRPPDPVPVVPKPPPGLSAKTEELATTKIEKQIKAAVAAEKSSSSAGPGSTPKTLASLNPEVSRLISQAQPVTSSVATSGHQQQAPSESKKPVPGPLTKKAESLVNNLGRDQPDALATGTLASATAAAPATSDASTATAATSSQAAPVTTVAPSTTEVPATTGVPSTMEPLAAPTDADQSVAPATAATSTSTTDPPPSAAATSAPSATAAVETDPAAPTETSQARSEAPSSESSAATSPSSSSPEAGAESEPAAIPVPPLEVPKIRPQVVESKARSSNVRLQVRPTSRSSNPSLHVP